MKTLLPFLLIFLFSCNQSNHSKSNAPIASTCEARGCSESDYCGDCKNYSDCKHCAKEGGTCGVCAPPKSAEKTKTAKRRENKLTIFFVLKKSLFL